MTNETDKAAILALIHAVDRAHYARDADAIVAAYTPEALIFNLAPPMSRTMQKKEIEAWLDTWEGPVERTAQQIEVIVGGDVAVAHGYYRTSATPRQGEGQAVFWSRATLALRRIDAAWSIVHEHTSVPFYMDGSFRAAVDLEP